MYNKEQGVMGLGDAVTDALLGTLISVAKGYAQTKCPNVTTITDDAIKAAIITAVASGKPLNTDTANSVVDALCGVTPEKKTIPQDAIVTGGTSSNSKYYYIAAIAAATLIMYFAFKK